MADTLLRDLYPPIEPHEEGVLPVGDGHRLAYELCGNPRGRPVVFLHGGPGSACVPEHRRFFDPGHWRIVLFDQRGAGRSRPLASLAANTTADLVGDIEAVRRHLGISRWVVFGGSWGSTLALAYAGTHPEACRALVLRGIWLCRPADLDWWLYGARIVYPDYWAEFAGHVPAAERGDLLAAYSRRLDDPDPAIHMPAAVAWKTWETRCATLMPNAAAKQAADGRTLAMARLEAHYFRHGAFVTPDGLLAGVDRFRQVPGVIVHGRYDMICPLDGARQLADAWPEAGFVVVPDAGHSAFEPGIRRQLVAATDRFRGLGE